MACMGDLLGYWPQLALLYFFDPIVLLEDVVGVLVVGIPIHCCEGRDPFLSVFQTFVELARSFR